MKINHLSKIVIIQSALQNLNAKFQNTKVGTTNDGKTKVVCFSTMYKTPIAGGTQATESLYQNMTISNRLIQLILAVV